MSHLQSILDTLRAYSLALEAKNPEFERLHLRGEGGKFSKKTPTYTAPKKTELYSGEESSLALKGLKQETKDVFKGRRILFHDPHIGYDITSGISGKPIPHPQVDGDNGRNLERGFHALVQTGATSGFTATYAPTTSRLQQSLSLNPMSDPMVMYPYYYAGHNRDGKLNTDHVHDLIQHIRKEFGDHADIELHRQLGHVVNGGWPSEDHMERVHSNDGGVRQDPKSALGVERSIQAALAVHPKKGKGQEEQQLIVQTAAQLIRERAKETGFLWDYPDLRLVNTPPPPAEKKNWTQGSMFTVRANNGVYTTLHRGTSPDTEANMMRAFNGYSRPAYMPKEWNDLLKPMNDTHLQAAKKALYNH